MAYWAPLRAVLAEARWPPPITLLSPRDMVLTSLPHCCRGNQGARCPLKIQRSWKEGILQKTPCSPRALHGQLREGPATMPPLPHSSTTTGVGQGRPLTRGGGGWLRHQETYRCCQDPGPSFLQGQCFQRTRQAHGLHLPQRTTDTGRPNARGVCVCV